MTSGVQTITPWNYISKCTVSCPSFTSITAHILLGNVRPTPVQEVGIAEVYKFPLASALAGPADPVGPAGVPAAAIAMPPGAPNWLQPLVGAMNALTATVNGIQVTVNNIQGNVNNLQVNVNNLQVDVNNLQTDITAMRAEQHILLLNSQADTEDPLYDPTAPPGQWVHLAAPNPTTRDVLSRFTRECNSVMNDFTFLPIPFFSGPMCCICGGTWSPIVTSQHCDHG